MKKSIIILIHVAFWILVLFGVLFIEWSQQFKFSIPGLTKKEVIGFFQFIYEHHIDISYEAEPTFFSRFYTWLFQLCYVLIPMGVFYLYYLKFIPQALDKNSSKFKRYLPVIFIVVTPFIIISILKHVFPLFIIWGGIGKYFIQSYIGTMLFAGLGSLFYFLIDWQKNKLIAETKVREQKESEIVLLKNQINPHFLFNTLNNIDSLIKSAPSKASEVLINLSELLRYMIYKTQDEKVSLNLEINSIRDYLEIQKIQYSNKELVMFSVEGNSENVKIAPMLFIPFVENAFKHSTGKEKPFAIQIRFKIEDKNVIFESENLFDKDEKISKDKSSGIGIANVEKRLKLLYPGKYILNKEQKEGKYHIFLKVNTDEN